MKRSLLFLALAGAFGLWLGSASSAFATCPTGKVGTLLNGNYAIKVIGAEIDSGIPTFDPQPAPIAGVGVFHADGRCGVTGGEFILNDNGAFTGPVPGSPAVQGFVGGSANLSGSYFLNTDNTGVLTLVDSAGGKTFNFGIAVEAQEVAGGMEFKGARIDNNSPPLSIVGEKQKFPVALTQFAPPLPGSSAVSIVCDGDGLPSNPLGFGDSPVGGTLQANLDPAGSGAIEAGGNFFYNNNGGTFDGAAFLPPGVGAFVCDFDQTFTSPPSIVDGTENTSAVFNADFGCFLVGLDDETSAVVWGTETGTDNQNRSAFVIRTGSFGATSYPGVATCTAGKANARGTDLFPSRALIVIPAASTSLTGTLVLTNASGKPLNLASMSLQGVPDVSFDASSTCPGAGVNPAGDVPAGNQWIGAPTNTFPAGTNTCNVVLSCNRSAAGTETGTLTINADNLIAGHIGFPPFPSGQSFNVKCVKS